MKPSVLVICIGCLFIFSCKDKKDEKPVTRPVKIDSSTASKVEKTGLSYAPVDISPMDMSYFPVDYPKLKMSKTINTPPLARVVYSRPHLQGRTLFHEVLQYGEPWRLGANEATEIDFFSDAVINSKPIKAGRYILYCIPGEDNWIIVLNSNIDSWGLQLDRSKDIAQFVTPARQIPGSLEYFTIVFEQTAKGPDLVMAWGNIEARLPIEFN